MTTKVKICGLNTSEVMTAALKAGADFVGLVFYPPSPRSLPIEAAAVLAEQARGRAAVVALIVDASDEMIDRIMRDVNPDLLQLQGSESPERAADIRTRTNRPVMKAIKVGTAADADAALAYRAAADLILFDAKAPKTLAGALPGGNGLSFDWHLLDRIRSQVPFVLSGGLSAANVAEAIAITGATMVDVSSGVETSPGRKDPDLIRAFIAAAKAASPSPPPTAPATTPAPKD
jgi:phosphoribosylanthranilate isomerase